MPDVKLVDLELLIKELPGVLGCVILTDADGAPSEIQAFTGADIDQAKVQEQIQEQVAKMGLAGHLRQVFVFELEAESQFGDRETLERAAELAEQDARARGPRRLDPVTELRSLQTTVTRSGPVPGTRQRPPLLRVSLSATSVTAEAQVALGAAATREVVGEASGERTPHGLKVLAEATLEAVERLVGEAKIELIGASLVTVLGHEAVLVAVKESGGAEMLGAALVREGPVPEAAVRATLDALNRRIFETT